MFVEAARACPRDQALGALVALRLAHVARPDLPYLVRAAAAWLQEAHAGDALYGLPAWLGELDAVAAELPADDALAHRALETVRALLHDSAARGPWRRAAVSPHAAADLIRRRAPGDRDEGWRLVRVEVPVLLDGARLPREAALLVGLQVHAQRGGSGAPVVVPDVAADTMTSEFLAGIRDARDAARGVLRALGAGDKLVDELAQVSVRPLGIRPTGHDRSRPLHGRSAGLAVALELLRHASTLNGHTPLPRPGVVVTGCVDTAPGFRLRPISPATAERKLTAVQTDGWYDGLLCPPIASDARVSPAIHTAASVFEAAEAVWGDAWTAWARHLGASGERARKLVRAIDDYLDAHALSHRPEETPHDQASWVTLEPRPGSGGAPGAEAGADASLDGGRATNAAGSSSADGDLGTAAPDIPREWAWDPFAVPARAAVVTGGPGAGKTWLLRRHVAAWLERARRTTEREGEFPLLFRAAALGAAITRTDNDEALSDAFADLLGIDREELGTLIERARAEGRLVVCIDAWEGAPLAVRQRVLWAIGRLVETGNRVVVACRREEVQIVAAVITREFVRAELRTLSEGGAREFVRGWFAAEPELADRLIGLRERHADLAAISRNPLLLEYVCRVGEEVRIEGFTRSRLVLDVLLRMLRRDAPAHAEAEARLAALGASAASLAAGWRAGLGSLGGNDLALALERQAGRPGDTAAGGPHAVLDDLVTSGVLVREVAAGSTSYRFAHQLLHAGCISYHLARLDPAERWEQLAPHRWFDPDWDDVFALCCGMADDPAPIVEELLRDEHDPWSTQLRRAAECLLEAATGVKQVLVDEVVGRVTRAIRAPRPGDDQRALAESLGRLVISDVRGAAEAALALIQDRADPLPEPIRAHLATSLAHASHPLGKVMLRDHALSPGIRGTVDALDALADLGDPSWIMLFEQRLTSRLSRSRLVNRTAALARASDRQLEQLIGLLYDKRVTIDARRELAAALAGVERAQGLVSATTSDPRVPWSVRAAAATELLRNHAVTDSVRALAASPNLASNQAALLAAAIVRSSAGADGDFGAQLLERPMSRASRNELTNALAMTPAGREQLRSVIGDEWDEHGSESLALMRAGDPEAAEAARAMFANGTLSGGAGVVVVRALAAGGLAAWRQIAETFFDAIGDDADSRVALGTLLAEGGALSPDLMRRLLLEEAPVEAVAQLIRAVWHSGTPRGVVDDVLSNADVPADRRADVAVAVCRAARRTPTMPIPEPARQLLDGGELSRAQQVLLATSLAQAGDPTDRALETLLEVLTYTPAPSRLLRSVLMSGSVGLERVRWVIERVSQTHTEQPRLEVTDPGKLDRLQRSVGETIMRYLLPDEVDSFDRYYEDQDDDGALVWLEDNVPFYSDIIRAELAKIEALDAAEAPGDESDGDAPDGRAEVKPLDRQAFGEWTKILGDDPAKVEESRAFLMRHAPNVELLAWLEAGDAEWPTDAAHHLLLGATLRHGVDAAYELTRKPALVERLLRTVEVGQGRAILNHAALLAVLAGESRDPGAFLYGCLGAVLAGQDGAAVELAAMCGGVIRQVEEEQSRAGLVRTALHTIDEVETMHALDDRPCMQTIRQFLRQAA